MRKLEYSVNLEHFNKIKEDIVPVLFTEHQFRLIAKRFSNKKMTASERNEFSRAISRKMNAISKILRKETKGVYVYGKEKIRPDRLKSAIRYLRKFSRKFKNKHIIITGSFLYSKRYNDIDLFVLSKYDKEDYNMGKFQINYLTEDAYHSLFFKSITKLCISNKEIGEFPLKEKINIDTFISIYQGLFNELSRMRLEKLKSTLRDFLLQAAFINSSPLPDSFDLRKEVDNIVKIKNPKEIIKNIFVNAVLMGIERKKALKEMKDMLSSYQDLMKEYKQHRNYYLDVMDAFKRVVSIES